MMKEAVMQDGDNNSLEAAIEAMRKSIARLTEQGELYTTAVPGLSLFRRIEPTGPITGMYEPSVCLVAQVAKRVQEARRLMLAERMDTATAAFQVGYESPSQFSREYNRLFGAPPLRDITNLRHMAAD